MRWLADEDLDNDILRGVDRYDANIKLDVVRVQDVGLSGASDTQVLEWAAKERRVVLTCDASTLAPAAYRRLISEDFMPGVFVVRRYVPIRAVIESIVLIEELSTEDEWAGRVTYLPFTTST